MIDYMRKNMNIMKQFIATVKDISGIEGVDEVWEIRLTFTLSVPPLCSIPGEI